MEQGVSGGGFAVYTVVVLMAPLFSLTILRSKKINVIILYFIGEEHANVICI